MRLAIYTDYAYRRNGDDIYADRAFALFIEALAGQLEDRPVLIGRLHPKPATGRYRLTEAVEFVALPYYETVTRPLGAMREIARSLRRFWRVLGGVDAVWLLGPHPVALLFVALTAARRRTVILGVRQDMGEYIRSRHPGRRWLWAIGGILEGLWRLIGRLAPVVVVGPQLADNYSRSPELLAVAISLIGNADIAGRPSRTDWDAEELEILSVGRLETEKNPLLLADILARLVERDPRWRLSVCGEGPLSDGLAQRLDDLGVAGNARLLGYLPLDEGLHDAYRGSHALLHVSWTEGLPQVLFEAFAAGLPVVATDVGGIRAAVGDATELVPAGDAEAAAAALERLRDDDALRARLVEAGTAQARDHTIEAETRRVADFMRRAAGKERS